MGQPENLGRFLPSLGLSLSAKWGTDQVDRGGIKSLPHSSAQFTGGPEDGHRDSHSRWFAPSDQRRNSGLERGPRAQAPLAAEPKPQQSQGSNQGPPDSRAHSGRWQQEHSGSWRWASPTLSTCCHPVPSKCQASALWQVWRLTAPPLEVWRPPRLVGETRSSFLSIKPGPGTGRFNE